MSKQQQRVDTSGGRPLTADNPFAGLSAAGLPEGPPAPAPAPPPPARSRGTLLLRRLTAGKGGKVVTEISGFGATSGRSDLPDPAELLRRLQARLGTGGCCKDGRIELQGEWRAVLKPLLEAEGYRVKGA